MLSMILGNVITSHASDYESMSTSADSSSIADNIDESNVSAGEIVEYLNTVDFGKNIRFEELPASTNTDNLMHFNSIEEAELYIKNVIKRTDANKRAFQSASLKNGALQAANSAKGQKRKAKNGWKDGTASWWGGGNTSILQWTHAKIHHYYKNGNISKISVTDSYISGVNVATWTHRSGTAKARGGTKINVTVNGTYNFTVDVMGFPIGTSYDETLNSGDININVS